MRPPVHDSVPPEADGDEPMIAISAPRAGSTCKTIRQALLFAHFVLSVLVGHLYMSSPLLLLGACAVIGVFDPMAGGTILASVAACVSLGYVCLGLAALVDPAFFEFYVVPDGRSPSQVQLEVILRHSLGLVLSLATFSTAIWALMLLKGWVRL